MMETQQPLKVTRTARIYRREDGIFLSVEMPVDRYTAAEAQENMSALVALSGDQPILLIVDIRQGRVLSREARNHFTESQLSQHVRAVALWVGSPTSKVLGNFFISLSRTSIPIKMFTSEQEAADWLNGLAR